MAATAARASLPTPQATIGTAKRLASSRTTRSRTSTATSTSQQIGAAARAQDLEGLVGVRCMRDARALVHCELGRGGEFAPLPSDDHEAHLKSPILLRPQW